MALVEALSIQVGPAVAKSILKYWLKDPGLFASLTSGVATGVIDILKEKTADVFAQQQGRLQFESIGQHVAVHLLPFFEQEGASLDEGDGEAVTIQVAKTLEVSHLGPELLVANDLNPALLEACLLEDVAEATRNFSDDATELYRRTIGECSQCIVDIASQLPTFTERTFGEILKRENQLVVATTKILEEVRQIRENTQQGEHQAQAARFEEIYRRAIIRQLDELELFGVDVSTASRRHRLSVAYVTLSVKQQGRVHQEASDFSDIIDTDNDGAEDDDDAIIMAVDAFLTQTKRLLLRGWAGSGKTTLLKWVAVRSAQQRFDEQLNAWNQTVPFFIRLRQVTDYDLPAPEDFPRLVVPAIAGKMPEQWVHAQLDSGRAIVLVDGVDEVPATQRGAVQNWLRQLVKNYPDARYIVSSRPHAIDEGWMAQEGFDEAELQPMERTNIEVFVDHWHAAVREVLQQEEKEQVMALIQPLKAIVADSRQIRELATNPLLCAMLCALNRDRNQQLPSDRVELYEACCVMLMERRDRERRIELADYPKLTLRQKRVLLQDFAYWLLRNGWSEVKVEEADERFKGRLKNLAGIETTITGDTVRRLFIDRTGIVREPVVGKIDFTHRTFQEYLAAQAALEEGDIGVLINNAENDQWREAVILAVGQARMKECGAIIKGLLGRGDKEKEHCHQLYLLAVGCLETAVELEPAITEAVQKRLEGLVPPKNMTEAKALSAAGELAIPHLVKKGSRRSVGVDKACVRTLALIGSERALTALIGYATDQRNGVRQEVINSWDKFKRDQFAREVISPMVTKDGYLQLRGVDNIEGISELTALRTLNLSGNWRLTDITPLRHLQRIQRLSLAACMSIGDLSVLRGLPELEQLGVSLCGGVATLTGRVLPASLRALDISYNGDVDVEIVLRGDHTVDVYNRFTSARIRTIANKRSRVRDVRVLHTGTTPTPDWHPNPEYLYGFPGTPADEFMYLKFGGFVAGQIYTQIATRSVEWPGIG